MSDSLSPRGRQPASLFRLWRSPGQGAGVGCHFLLQGIEPESPASPALLADTFWLIPGRSHQSTWILGIFIFSYYIVRNISPEPAIFLFGWCFQQRGVSYWKRPMSQTPPLFHAKTALTPSVFFQKPHVSMYLFRFGFVFTVASKWGFSSFAPNDLVVLPVSGKLSSALFSEAAPTTFPTLGRWAGWRARSAASLSV